MVRYGHGLFALLSLLAGLALTRVGPLAAVTPSGAPRTAGQAAPAASAADLPPLMLGPWQGRALPVDARAQDILETDDVALLEYRRGAEAPPVWFAQVVGFGTRAAFHPPELCYVGSHYEILAREPITILAQGRPYRVMRLLVGQGQHRFEAWYWFTANGRITPSYYQQQLWLVLDAIAGKPMAGRLIRISTTADDPQAARDRLAGFLESLDGAL